MDWIESTVHCMEYLESNYLFFSTMLASEGARYFRDQFLKFNIEEFKKDVDITKGKNHGQSEDVIVEFVANAYVGVVEWWLKTKCLIRLVSWQKKWGIVREDCIIYLLLGFSKELSVCKS